MAEASEEQLFVPPSMRVSARTARMVHTFTVPEHTKLCSAHISRPLAQDDDGCDCGRAPQVAAGFRSVSLFELTADEETNILGRAATNPAKMMRAQYELVKAALAQVDGKAVSPHDESLDMAWNAIRPQGRTMLLKAFQQVHNPSAEVEADFLAGRTSTVR